MESPSRSHPNPALLKSVPQKHSLATGNVRPIHTFVQPAKPIPVEIQQGFQCIFSLTIEQLQCMREWIQLVGIPDWLPLDHQCFVSCPQHRSHSIYSKYPRYRLTQGSQRRHCVLDNGLRAKFVISSVTPCTVRRIVVSVWDGVGSDLGTKVADSWIAKSFTNMGTTSCFSDIQTEVFSGIWQAFLRSCLTWW